MTDSSRHCPQQAARPPAGRLRTLLPSLAIALSALSAPACGAERIDVVYPRPESPVDARNDYCIQLLDLVLKKTGVPYATRPYPEPMGQSRAMLQLEKNGGVDVLWTMTSREREDAMLPVRIPLDKGLLGWRIFLIKQRDRAEFEHVRTLEDLKQYRAGQGHDWPDTEILRANGLKVEIGTGYESLFKMLQADRFQYFPRGVLEAPTEINTHRDLGVDVEPTLALHYPATYYFFVNKNNTALAELLERGLRIAIRDGSFEKLFERFNADAIRQAHLKTRHVIELDNPTLSAETPLSSKELWFHP